MIIILKLIAVLYLSGAIGAFIGYRQSEAYKSYPEWLWLAVVFWPYMVIDKITR